jgi:hypothetical protein
MPARLQPEKAEETFAVLVVNTQSKTPAYAGVFFRSVDHGALTDPVTSEECAPSC